MPQVACCHGFPCARQRGADGKAVIGLRYVVWGEVFKRHLLGRSVYMEGGSDNPEPFQKKSSVSCESPAYPWQVCLPIS